jgi:hypothetical protein
MDKWNRREMGGFYIGQLVRLSEEGKNFFSKSIMAHDVSGVVEVIGDLSFAIKHDDPSVKRNFYLKVHFKGYAKGSRLEGNGIYFEPVRERGAP